MHETGGLGLVWMSEQLRLGSRKTDNLSLRGRERRKENASRQEDGGKEGGTNRGVI